LTLRNRLLVALLGLALLPTAVFTLFTLDQLNRSIDRWSRPGVARALEAGLDIGKSSLARIEAILMEQADLWADRWKGSLTPAARAAWVAALPVAGVDFMQVYRRGSDRRWRLIEQVVPKGVLVATTIDISSEIDAALSTNQPIRSARGVLAGVNVAADSDAEVTGIAVQP
jgi:hypothetical protein